MIEMKRKKKLTMLAIMMPEGVGTWDMIFLTTNLYTLKNLVHWIDLEE
jgi:lipid-A-disaccharide synthase-like uncharacterized protein